MMRQMSILLKPSLNWLLVFVPAALAIRLWPGLANETMLFGCTCLAIVPLAGLMGRATEALACRMRHGARFSFVWTAARSRVQRPGSSRGDRGRLSHLPGQRRRPDYLDRGRAAFGCLCEFWQSSFIFCQKQRALVMPNENDYRDSL